jgi:hypothetical protein
MVVLMIILAVTVAIAAQQLKDNNHVSMGN